MWIARESLTNNDGRTGLHCAVIGNSLSCVRTLVDAGADVNVRDYEGNTSLYYASSSIFTSSSSLLHNKKTHNAKNTAEVGEISQLLSKTNADSRIKEIKMIMPINEEQQQKSEHVSKIDEEKVNKVISLMIEKGASQFRKQKSTITSACCCKARKQQTHSNLDREWCQD